MTNNLKKNNYTAVLGSESRPGPEVQVWGLQKVAGPDLDQTMDSLADVHAGFLPIELALLKATHRATIHLMTLPQTHPLHSIILSTKVNPP